MWKIQKKTFVFHCHNQNTKNDKNGDLLGGDLRF